MPFFSTRSGGGGGLSGEIRRAIGGGLSGAIRRAIGGLGGEGLDPMQAIAIDQAAANTAHKQTLVEKMRNDIESQKASDTARRDPATAARFATHAAGLDEPTGNRLAAHLRGEFEQPGTADFEDAAVVGRQAQPFPMAAPNIEPAQRRLFQNSIAATMANLLATGKSNAEQLAHAGERIHKTGLISQAAQTPDVPSANRIIAAVSGKPHKPFKASPQGAVLNEETGALNEDTKIVREALRLSGARVATEGARQGELRTRSGWNDSRATSEVNRQGEFDARAGQHTAQAELARVRADAVRRGETGRRGQRVSPQQVERWVSEVAKKEWEVIPHRQRKGMNYDQHLAKVRERFKTTATAAGTQDEVADALAIIARGADRAAVAKRFKERLGFDLPTSATLDEGRN